jgi:hypothetical protein
MLDRKHHETVVVYGGMQLLIALGNKSGVMDAVKDLAAQALYMLWSEEGSWKGEEKGEERKSRRGEEDTWNSCIVQL